MTLTRMRIKSDRELQEDVQAELNRDWHFKSAEVGVEVDSGVVTLTGTVSSYLKIGQAADVATKVAGVKDVANKLTVEGSAFSDDTKVAQAVRSALLLDEDVPDARIDSVVRDGVVTLSGTVDHWSQRQAAHDAIARLSGVRSVNNHVVVTPKVRTDEQIFEEIRAVLRRRLPSFDIDVAVVDAAVTLQGKVSSYPTRYDAEQIAWGTPAVKSVLNKIVIEY